MYFYVLERITTKSAGEYTPVAFCFATISPYAEVGAANLIFQWPLGPSYATGAMAAIAMPLTDWSRTISSPSKLLK